MNYGVRVKLLRLQEIRQGAAEMSGDYVVRSALPEAWRDHAGAGEAR